MVGWLRALLLVLLLAPASVQAAEVLQVRSATLLQIGDQNRNYSVELACIQVKDGQQTAAADWLRHELPRRVKVNLRPVGSDNGTLVARVQRLDRKDGSSSTDMAEGLVAAGLAQPLPGCSS
ncbi:MAG: nuclease [Synechococcaceae bacterium WB8_1B_136]|nr:nuclease [Synechococcaceae bacterium WB8_1B_136]